jgi:hypothetical protein
MRLAKTEELSMTENHRRNVIPSSDPEGRELTAAETIWSNFIITARHQGTVTPPSDLRTSRVLSLVPAPPV